MTESEFLTSVRAYMAAHPAQRYGQAVFNVLHKLDPDAAREIDQIDLDPFFIDERVPALLQWLRDREPLAMADRHIERWKDVLDELADQD